MDDRQPGVGVIVPPGTLLRLGNAPLIGRERELAVLDAEIADPRGTPRALLLTGEAGIGKSRLLREAQARAAAAGWRGLSGGAEEEVAGIPYLPWQPILHALLTERVTDDEASRVRDLAVVRALVPMAAGDASPSVHADSAEPPISEERKLRLYDALVRLLADASEALPIVISLDDVQWLDSASADLVRYVALHGSGRLLLLLAARTEELPRNAAVSGALDDMNHARRLATHPIPRLTLQETASLLAAILGARDDRLAQSLHAQSDGNPFLLEETLQALVGGEGDGLPRGVLALVDRRLRRMSSEAQQLVRTAALLGRRFPLSVVAALSPAEPGRLADLLDEAIAAAVLLPMPGDADEAIFVHDCIREVILRGLNPVRRRALHLQIAHALEAQSGRPDLAQVATLAHHFAGGQAPAEAAHYAQLAGDAAIRQHAYADARDWYQLALRNAAALPEDEAPGERAQRLMRYARATAATGGYAESITSLQAAARLFQGHADAQNAGRAFRDLGSVFARREDPTSARAAFEQALALFGEDGDTQEGADVLLRLAGLLGLSTAEYDRAVAYGERALAMSVRLHDLALEASARLALANTVARSGNLAAGRAMLLPAVELARRLGDPDSDAEIHGALATIAYWAADIQGSEAATERRLQLALESGDPYALRHVYLWQANLAYTRGRWSRAQELLATAEPILRRLDSPEPRAFQRQIAGLIKLQQGDAAAAADELAAASAAFRSIAPGTLLWYAGCACRAQAAAGLGDEAEASIAELDQLIDELPAGSLPRGPALGQLGLLAVDREDRDLAARVYPRLLPHAGQHHWVLMDRVLGSLATLRGDWHAAERFLDGAERAARRGGILPETALATAARAQMLALRDAAGDLPTARTLWARAQASFGALGMRRDERRAAAAIAALTQRRRPAEFGTLSDRELEVLRLVAAGLTNRAIAAQLVISERTVNNHLTHILTKTNTGNRAAASSYALRHGLI